MTAPRPTLDEVLALVDQQRALERRSGVLPPGARVRVDGLNLVVDDPWGGVAIPWSRRFAWLGALGSAWERHRELAGGRPAVEEATPARILSPLSAEPCACGVGPNETCEHRQGGR